ncbi:dTDP-D-glucose 4,6-dehydratase [Ilyonectria robusta]
MTASTHEPANGLVNGHHYVQDVNVWKKAPVLTGTTKFEPRPDVKNIMVTGGAGFM